jgi:hypothetical protein
MNTVLLTQINAVTLAVPKNVVAVDHSVKTEGQQKEEGAIVVEPKAPPFKRTLAAPTVKTLLAASSRKSAYAELPPDLV